MDRFDAMAAAKIFAGKTEDVPKNLKMIKYPALASVKYDGWRMFDIDGEVRLRSLKPPKNASVRRRMAELFAESRGLGYKGLDGESIPGDPYAHDAMQRCGMFNRLDDPEPFGFYVFDSFHDPNLPFESRLKYAHEAVTKLREIGYDWVHPVEHVLVEDQEQLFLYYDEVIARGLEGVMGRHPWAPYKFGRSTLRESWLWALKPYVDDEAVIIGFKEMQENQNDLTYNERGYAERKGGQAGLVPKGTLGKFVCASDKWPETFGVGMGVGLTFELRDAVWENPEKYLGRFIKYKYQEVGGKVRPRQPKFMGFRDASDLGVDKAGKLADLYFGLRCA